MGDLFFNKVAGVILAVALFMMALSELTNIVFGRGVSAELAYPVDLTALQAAAPAPEDASGPVDFGLLLASADLSAGERTARRCVACHTFNQGGANGTGPNLWGVMGRAVAEVAGFNYSSAMNAYGSGGTSWQFENMYDYLENPRGYVPGTSMSFAGLRDAQERINIIAYMRAQDDEPLPLPAPLAAETAGEDVTADAGVEADMAVEDPAMEQPANAGEMPAAEGGAPEAQEPVSDDSEGNEGEGEPDAGGER